MRLLTYIILQGFFLSVVKKIQILRVMYVLDEPSIGLHQRDNGRLLDTLKNLRDIGNSVIVVEHDQDAIQIADYVVDMGPGAGEHGGLVVAQGTPEEIQQDSASLTGKYLSGTLSIPIPDTLHIANTAAHAPCPAFAAQSANSQPDTQNRLTQEALPLSWA